MVAERMSSFGDIAARGPIRIWEGILARTVAGEQLSLAVVELDPGSVVREHSHENEQLGIVVSGSVTFRIGDETRELRPAERGRSRRTPHTKCMPGRRARS
ncbi:hypothetical protein BH20ACT13_BH20ACT13_12880 [soil metagenome]